MAQAWVIIGGEVRGAGFAFVGAIALLVAAWASLASPLSQVMRT